jgi:seryl-tRNA synthetase
MNNSDTLNQNSANSNQPGSSIIDLTTLINRYVAEIKQLKENIKGNKQMFDDAFENDKNYHEQEEKIKELTRAKNAVKQTIVKQPAVEASLAKIKTLKEELKDSQEALSRYLEEYQRVANTNIIEDENGDIREIIRIFKLVKRDK